MKVFCVKCKLRVESGRHVCPVCDHKTTFCDDERGDPKCDPYERGKAEGRSEAFEKGKAAGIEEEARRQYRQDMGDYMDTLDFDTIRKNPYYVSGRADGRMDVFERFRFGCFNDQERLCTKEDCVMEKCPMLKGVI